MVWIENLFRDLGYGARLFRRQPGTTFLAVLTLSLGIGANAVIFSLLHAALIQPLPFPAADRLVAVVDSFVTEGRSDVSPTIPELLDVRAATHTLNPISFFDMRDAQINGGTEPARAVSARVEADFLRTLGAQPALGRLFTPADHAPGHDRIVILSDVFWRRNFGADPAVIDRGIIVNGAPHTIVGVLPQSRPRRCRITSCARIRDTPAFRSSRSTRIPTTQGLQTSLQHRFAKGYLGGWQISGITRVQSGVPLSLTANLRSGCTAGFTCFVPTNNFGTDITGGSEGWRAVQNGSAVLPRGKRTVDEWFDTSVFSPPALAGQVTDMAGVQRVLAIGNVGRRIARGPGMFNTDLALFKNIDLAGRPKAQLRFEAYNVFNQTQFDTVNVTATWDQSGVQTNPSFGHVTGARDPRIMQLAIQLRF